ncbi:MAG TPA: DeoR/GlpR family DNA-binding transcription regulator [Terracidiphilus sp.]|jgi:DeoR family transcriptional regulator of aga operon|nr:DeoR/GlpR family DNA-binding transcription regulator [Terracidiphilus sp.]
MAKRGEVFTSSNGIGSASEKQQQRFKAVLTALQQNGSVSVDELSTELGVTVVTVRRDLDTLEQQGLLRRTHGGAVSLEPLFYEPFRKDRSFLAQVGHLADEKRRIGRAAAALVGEGETIAVTPGTTATEVVRCLPLNHNLTVVTNTANVAMELSKRRDVNVFVTGGHLHGDWFSLVGPTAIRSLENMLIHTLFVGADGLDAEWGASCYIESEAELNAAMLRQSRRHIAVIDHTKFGKVANWRICEIGNLQTIVTDSGATDEMIAPFLALGIEVIRA